jgi:hypothetical protein
MPQLCTHGRELAVLLLQLRGSLSSSSACASSTSSASPSPSLSPSQSPSPPVASCPPPKAALPVRGLPARGVLNLDMHEGGARPGHPRKTGQQAQPVSQLP